MTTILEGWLRRGIAGEVIKYAARGCEGTLITPKEASFRLLDLLSHDVYFKGCHWLPASSSTKEEGLHFSSLYMYCSLFLSASTNEDVAVFITEKFHGGIVGTIKGEIDFVY